MVSRIGKIAACVILLSLASGCGKKVTRDTGKSELPPKKNETATVEKDAEIEKKYLNEGFITRDIFRVIILAPEEECQNGTTEIEYRARKRAEASLQKFLVSKDRIIDQNTRASILNLIENHGKLLAKDIHCKGNNVFYYDIERPNLKRHLKKITKSRN